MIKNEFIDLGFEIWMRLLQNAGESNDQHSEDIEIQHPSETSILPKH
jgi:CRISPR/Cas system-associated protein endoribonuclease Cas2